MDKTFSDANAITRDYFEKLLLEERLMGSVVPDASTEIFGHRFDTPITTAALSHLGDIVEPNVESQMQAYARGALLAGAMHFIGMSEEEGFDEVMSVEAKTVRIVKPYADESKVEKQILRAKERGAIAVGIDVDHVFDRNGDPDVVVGELMSVKSLDRMKEYIGLTDLPFVIKGVLSVRDALICRDIGIKGIVVSHHAGRLRYAVPPLMVLPEIRKAVGKDLTIFVDCTVASGLDVYKAMALGADAVSVGKHLMPILKEQGAEGVADRITEMTRELKGAMAFTGVRDTKSFDPSVIHLRNF